MMSIATIAISIDVRLSKRVPWERVWSLVTGLHDPDGDTAGSRADARNLCPRYPYWYVAPIAGTDPANPKPARSEPVHSMGTLREKTATKGRHPKVSCMKL